MTSWQRVEPNAVRAGEPVRVTLVGTASRTAGGTVDVYPADGGTTYAATVWLHAARTRPEAVRFEQPPAPVSDAEVGTELRRAWMDLTPQARVSLREHLPRTVTLDLDPEETK